MERNIFYLQMFQSLAKKKFKYKCGLINSRLNIKGTSNGIWIRVNTIYCVEWNALLSTEQNKHLNQQICLIAWAKKEDNYGVECLSFILSV